MTKFTFTFLFGKSLLGIVWRYRSFSSGNWIEVWSVDRSKDRRSSVKCSSLKHSRPPQSARNSWWRRVFSHTRVLSSANSSIKPLGPQLYSVFNLTRTPSGSLPYLTYSTTGTHTHLDSESRGIYNTGSTEWRIRIRVTNRWDTNWWKWNPQEVFNVS